MSGKPRRSAVRWLASFAGASFFAMAMAALASSCASTPDANRFTAIQAPDYNQFKGNAAMNQVGPHAFMERRCATLDCHGQVGRPLRLYSAQGLRFPDDAQNAPGGAGITETELAANYQAIIGLQPEQISRVVLDPTNNPPQSLILVSKPRGCVDPTSTPGCTERHKGGQVIFPGDDADSCLTSWLQGSVDYGKCAAAAMVP